MSLSRYFSQQPVSSMSAHTRMRVYSDFLQKKKRQSTSRWSEVLKSKKIRQTSMVIISGMVLLVSSFLLNNTQIPSSIMASNIGLITKQSNTTILSDGRNITSDTIQLYDEINVGNNGVISIRMNNGFDVNVPGPANFTIVPSVDDTDLGSYTIQFATDNNYVAIDSITEENSEKNKHTVSVKMGDVTYQPQRKNADANVSFTIDNKTLSSKITNKGEAEILISANDNHNILGGDNDSAIIASSQITEITTSGTGTIDIAIIASTPLESGNIIGTSGEDNIKKNTIAKTSIVKVPSNTRTISSNGKVILLDKEVESLKNNMEQSFVKRDIENIAYQYLIGNKAGGNIVRDNLLARMNRINEIIGNGTYIPAGNTIKDLIEYNQYLIEQTNNFENIPYKFTKNINTIEKWLELIKVYQLGVAKSMLSGDREPSLDEIFQKVGISNIIEGQSSYIFKK